jgi:hypothetical protein
VRDEPHGLARRRSERLPFYCLPLGCIVAPPDDGIELRRVAIRGNDEATEG